MSAADYIILGCVSGKLETGMRPVMAADLYVSPLWNCRRAYAVGSGKPWGILSAAYGLIPPTWLVLTYDETIARLSHDARSALCARTRSALIEQFGGKEASWGKTIEVHAGKSYVDLLHEAACGLGITFTTPLEGMGIGQQLAAYSAGTVPQLSRSCPDFSSQPETKTTMTTKIADIVFVALTRISPDQLNPRTHFASDGLDELQDNIRQHGIITNLVVRPAWCEGTTTTKQLEAARPAGEAQFDGMLKLVSGERRWRSCTQIVKSGTLGKLNPEEIPVRIKALTDPEYEEMTLAEQIGRQALTPIEEAKSFKKLLDYVDEAGKKRHTPESLAKKLGFSAPSQVYGRLKLLELDPVGAKALEEGRLGLTVATRLARIPDQAARARATKEVMKGLDGEPMSARQTLEHIAKHYMRELKHAPFDQANAGLCADTAAGAEMHGKWSGACSDCPFRTGNNKALFGDVKRGDICTRPACFEVKAAATIALKSAQAVKEGKKVLTAAESAAIFPPHMQVGMTSHTSRLVKLEERPLPHLLKAVVRNAPTWGELVEKLAKASMKPQIYAVTDQGGLMVDMVEFELVIAGAEKAGEPIFRGKNEPASPADKEFKLRQQEEQHETKIRGMVAHAAFDAMREELPKRIKPAIQPKLLWQALGLAALDMLDGEGASFLGKWLKIKLTGPADWVEEVQKWYRKLPADHQLALVPLLLIAEKVRWHGMAAKGVPELADWLKVDLKAIEKKVRAENKPKSKEQGAKSQPTPAAKVTVNKTTGVGPTVSAPAAVDDKPAVPLIQRKLREFSEVNQPLVKLYRELHNEKTGTAKHRLSYKIEGYLRSTDPVDMQAYLEKYYDDHSGARQARQVPADQLKAIHARVLAHVRLLSDIASAGIVFESPFFGPKAKKYQASLDKKSPPTGNDNPSERRVSSLLGSMSNAIKAQFWETGTPEARKDQADYYTQALTGSNWCFLSGSDGQIRLEETKEKGLFDVVYSGAGSEAGQIISIPKLPMARAEAVVFAVSRVVNGKSPSKNAHKKSGGAVAKAIAAVKGSMKSTGKKAGAS